MEMRSWRLVLLLAWSHTVTLGCNDDSDLCTRSEECPAGQICADGICTPVVRQDGGKHDLGFDSGSDLTPDHPPPADLLVPDGLDGGPICKGNGNGQIERDEMIFTVPSKVTVVLGTNLQVDLKGSFDGLNTIWDLTGSAADDHKEDLLVENVPAWIASEFPTATYSSKLMGDYGFFTSVNLMGVFEVKPTALQLIGAVSDTKNHTKFSYDKPLDTLRFPIVVKDSYTTSATVTGYTEYTVPAWMNEEYTIDVLAKGKVKLIPQFSLPALLVRVRQEAYPIANPFLTTTTTAFLFVAECYGTVARIVADGDPGDALEKVDAKERWRLAAP
jgi:hypothetical protein